MILGIRKQFLFTLYIGRIFLVLLAYYLYTQLLNY